MADKTEISTETEISAEEARAGHTGDHVRFILAVSIAVAAACFVVLLIWYGF